MSAHHEGQEYRGPTTPPNDALEAPVRVHHTDQVSALNFSVTSEGKHSAAGFHLLSKSLTHKHRAVKELLQDSPQVLVLLMSHEQATALKNAIQGHGGFRRWKIDTHRSVVMFSDNAKDWKAIDSTTNVEPKRRALRKWAFTGAVEFGGVVLCASFLGALIFWIIVVYEPALTAHALSTAVTILAATSAVLKFLGAAVTTVVQSAQASGRAFRGFMRFVHLSARKRVRQRLQNVLDAMVDWLNRGIVEDAVGLI